MIKERMHQPARQYIITYKDEAAFEKLKSYGSITYSSVVVNILFMDSTFNESELMNVGGVMSVKETTRRLRNNNQYAY